MSLTQLYLQNMLGVLKHLIPARWSSQRRAEQRFHDAVDVIERHGLMAYEYNAGAGYTHDPELMEALCHLARNGVLIVDEKHTLIGGLGVVRATPAQRTAIAKELLRARLRVVVDNTKS